MPGFLWDLAKKVFGLEGKFLSWLFHEDSAWFNWVDSSIHSLFRMCYEIYIILTWDLANFSYYVASFSQQARIWVQWIAFERIPNFYVKARHYAAWKVGIERRSRVREVRWLRVLLTRYIVHVYMILAQWIRWETASRKAEIARVYNILLKYITKVALELQNQITAEVRNRKAAILALRTLMIQMFAALQKQVNAIIPSINKQAADGYNSVRSDQANIITKVIDSVATDNPLVKDLVGRLVTVIIDLAEVDDPLIRIVAAGLLRQLIDRLGVDKLAGGLAQDLAGIFLGSGPPGTVRQVEAAVAQRLNAGEQQWQQFFDNGGDDLEQLGNQMRESASPLFTLPLGAYFAGAVLDPAGTAAATDAVLTPAARAIITPLLAVLGG
jgi:hypothetical protein